MNTIYITVPAVKYFPVTDVQGAHFAEERLEAFQVTSRKKGLSYTLHTNMSEGTWCTRLFAQPRVGTESFLGVSVIRSITIYRTHIVFQSLL